MSVLVETSLGDIVIDLYTEKAPNASFNFIKLCQMKFYNNVIIHDVQKDYIALMGDPAKSGLKRQESSIWGLFDSQKRFFKDELNKVVFKTKGLVATANTSKDLNASTFFITLTN